MEQDTLTQTQLDELVAILSKPSGSESIGKLLHALYSRLETLKTTIADAQVEGRDTYKAYRALGGGRMLGLETIFLVPQVGEIIPAATLPAPRSVGKPAKSSYRRAWVKIELPPGDIATFWNMVNEEYGRPPTHSATAAYFGIATGSVNKQLHLAEAAGFTLAPVPRTRPPANFDARIARRFGTYAGSHSK